MILCGCGGIALLPSKRRQWTLHKSYKGEWVGLLEGDEDSCAHNFLQEYSLGRLGRVWGKQDREGRKPKIYVSVSCCCITNFPKLEYKTINIYYLMVSVSQESRNALARWGLLRSLRGLQSRSWPELQASQGWTERRSTSKLIPVSAERPQVLPGCSLAHGPLCNVA